jgi:hypothetical protein
VGGRGGGSPNPTLPWDWGVWFIHTLHQLEGEYTHTARSLVLTHSSLGFIYDLELQYDVHSIKMI